jgi:hypothetical protein
VLAVLANPAYRRAAGRLRAEIAALPGPEHAVALLERLATEKRPIPASPDGRYPTLPKVWMRRLPRSGR